MKPTEEESKGVKSYIHPAPTYIYRELYLHTHSTVSHHHLRRLCRQNGPFIPAQQPTSTQVTAASPRSLHTYQRFQGCGASSDQTVPKFRPANRPSTARRVSCRGPGSCCATLTGRSCGGPSERMVCRWIKSDHRPTRRGQ